MNHNPHFICHQDTLQELLCFYCQNEWNSHAACHFYCLHSHSSSQCIFFLTYYSFTATDFKKNIIMQQEKSNKKLGYQRMSQINGSLTHHPINAEMSLIMKYQLCIQFWQEDYPKLHKASLKVKLHRLGKQVEVIARGWYSLSIISALPFVFLICYLSYVLGICANVLFCLGVSRVGAGSIQGN